MHNDDLINIGKKLYLEGNLEEAKNCFLQILDVHSTHLEALNNLAVIMFHEGQYELAQDTFKKILSIDPAHKDGLVNLYDLLKNNDNEAHFIPYMEQAVAAAPQDQELEQLFKTVREQSYLKAGLHKATDVITGDAFFVLSPGRCGISTLNEVINTAENVYSEINPQPDLVQGALEAFWNRIDKREFILTNRYRLIDEASKNGLLHGETAPAITPFAGVLADIVPKARFVIIVRDPLTYTRSALFQNFYHGHPDDGFRLTPLKGTDAYLQWGGKSQAEKICWLWNEFYHMIEKVTSGIDQSRMMVIRFEDLFGSMRAFRKLFDFLKLEGFSSSRVSDVLRTKRNVNNYGRFPTVGDWSPEFRGAIEQATRKQGSKYGYAKDDQAEAGKRSKKRAVHVKKGPTVTIGLPLYSGGKMLTDSVESILSQDFENFELIISDHGADPLVREIGDYYQKLDSRVKYVYTGDRINYIGIHNFARLIELSTSTYFMWGSYDDRLEKSFISSCLKVIEEDADIALVYPKSKVFNHKGELIGLGNDTLRANADDPFDRFLHVIWELNMCHAFHGLFRRSYMRKTHSLRMNCYAHDNLFLAEIALLGKIIQIEDVLFIRRLTRNYKKTWGEHYADIINTMDPLYMEEGLTLPYCRFTYSNCELVNHSPLPPERKDYLTREILRCFRKRWAGQLNYEINHLIRLLKKGVYYQTWDGRTYSHEQMKEMPNLHNFHVSDVLKTIREALFIFPEHRDLQKIFVTCMGSIILSNNIDKVSTIF